MRGISSSIRPSSPLFALINPRGIVCLRSDVGLQVLAWIPRGMAAKGWRLTGLRTWRRHPHAIGSHTPFIMPQVTPERGRRSMPLLRCDWRVLRFSRMEEDFACFIGSCCSSMARITEPTHCEGADKCPAKRSAGQQRIFMSRPGGVRGWPVSRGAVAGPATFCRSMPRSGATGEAIYRRGSR